MCQTVYQTERFKHGTCQHADLYRAPQLAVNDLVSKAGGYGEDAHAASVVDGFDKIPIFDRGDQLIKIKITTLNICGRHAHDRLECAVGRTCIAGKRLIECNSSLGTVQASCQYAVFDKIILACACSLVIIRNISAAGDGTTVNNR